MDINTIINRASAIASERVETFEIEDLEGGHTVRLSLYPLTAGKLLRCASALRRMHLSADAMTGDNPLAELLQVTQDCTEDVTEVIAIATLRTKQEVDEQLEERKKLILWSPTVTQDVLVHLLLHICTRSMCEDFMNAIRLAKTLPELLTPNSQRERIASASTAVGASGV